MARTATDPDVALTHLVLAANAQAKARALEDHLRATFDHTDPDRPIRPPER
ncbi:MAG: hypothetical protein IT562_21610 [Alphaproteobacteria bacterium]|nr:hypothetical protein [Alphaproteobacteria bacterium]